MFQLLQNGFDPQKLPGEARAFELARAAEGIRQEAHDGGGQDDRGYEARWCRAADGVLATLSGKEAEFFKALFGGAYQPPEQRASEGAALQESQEEQGSGMSESGNVDDGCVGYEKGLAAEALQGRRDPRLATPQARTKGAMDDHEREARAIAEGHGIASRGDALANGVGRDRAR